MYLGFVSVLPVKEWNRNRICRIDGQDAGMPQDSLNAAMMYQPFKAVGKLSQHALQAILMPQNPSL